LVSDAGAPLQPQLSPAVVDAVCELRPDARCDAAVLCRAAARACEASPALFATPRFASWLVRWAAALQRGVGAAPRWWCECVHHVCDPERLSDAETSRARAVFAAVDLQDALASLANTVASAPEAASWLRAARSLTRLAATGGVPPRRGAHSAAVWLMHADVRLEDRELVALWCDALAVTVWAQPSEVAYAVPAPCVETLLGCAARTMDDAVVSDWLCAFEAACFASAAVPTPVGAALLVTARVRAALLALPPVAVAAPRWLRVLRAVLRPLAVELYLDDAVGDALVAWGKHVRCDDGAASLSECIASLLARAGDSARAADRLGAAQLARALLGLVSTAPFGNAASASSWLGAAELLVPSHGESLFADATRRRAARQALVRVGEVAVRSDATIIGWLAVLGRAPRLLDVGDVVRALERRSAGTMDTLVHSMVHALPRLRACESTLRAWCVVVRSMARPATNVARRSLLACLLQAHAAVTAASTARDWSRAAHALLRGSATGTLPTIVMWDPALCSIGLRAAPEPDAVEAWCCLLARLLRDDHLPSTAALVVALAAAAQTAIQSASAVRWWFTAVHYVARRGTAAQDDDDRALVSAVVHVCRGVIGGAGVASCARALVSLVRIEVRHCAVCELGDAACSLSAHVSNATACLCWAKAIAEASTLDVPDPDRPGPDRCLDWLDDSIAVCFATAALRASFLHVQRFATTPEAVRWWCQGIVHVMWVADDFACQAIWAALLAVGRHVRDDQDAIEWWARAVRVSNVSRAPLLRSATCHDVMVETSRGVASADALESWCWALCRLIICEHRGRTESVFATEAVRGALVAVAPLAISEREIETWSNAIWNLSDAHPPSARLLATRAMHDAMILVARSVTTTAAVVAWAGAVAGITRGEDSVARDFSTRVLRSTLVSTHRVATDEAALRWWTQAVVPLYMGATGDRTQV